MFQNFCTAMIDSCQGKVPLHYTTITCMETINKNSEEVYICINVCVCVCVCVL
jgi:hypothetical protein